MNCVVFSGFISISAPRKRTPSRSELPSKYVQQSTSVCCIYLLGRRSCPGPSSPIPTNDDSSTIHLSSIFLSPSKTCTTSEISPRYWLFLLSSILPVSVVILETEHGCCGGRASDRRGGKSYCGGGGCDSKSYCLSLFISSFIPSGNLLRGGRPSWAVINSNLEVLRTIARTQMMPQGPSMPLSCYRISMETIFSLPGCNFFMHSAKAYLL